MSKCLKFCKTQIGTQIKALDKTNWFASSVFLANEKWHFNNQKSKKKHVKVPQILQNPIRYWHDVSRCIILKSSRNLTLGTCDRVYLVVDRHSKSAKAYMSLYYKCDMYSHFGNPRMSLILRSPFSHQLLAWWSWRVSKTAHRLALCLGHPSTIFFYT